MSGSDEGARPQPAPVGSWQTVVTAREPVGPRAVLLTVLLPGRALPLAPGQFVMARAWSAPDPLLRRPLAPFDVRVRADGTQLDLLVVAGGRGTRRIAALEPGATLDLLGPLGRGFGPLPAGRPVWLVGGGVGVAPLHHMVAELVRREEAERLSRLHVVLGARSGEALFGREAFEAAGLPVLLATDRGDVGLRGTAIDALAQRLAHADDGSAIPYVYGCGPEPMLRALVALCRERGWQGEVSVERYMACGFGVCFTCTCEVREPDRGRVHRVRSCLEGPVFPIERLAW
ncbi:MAG: hypothetical protein D6776_03135 [Planctomycetota bacterium]|nr:MAG: hypothetical protein D6776_03135 [Planctomycetota bacterium]